MKIGVIGAMKMEVETLKTAMENRTDTVVSGMEFSSGTFNGLETVVVQSGIGKVNAAVCAEILIQIFHVSHVLNTGIAGSLNNDLNIGDILVSNDAVYHDMDVLTLGYQQGGGSGDRNRGVPGG